MRKAGVVCAVAAAAGDVAKSCCESLVARKEERAPPAKQLQLVLRRKTAAKQLLLLSYSRPGCQMLPLVRCHNIHFTIPVDIIVGHQGQKYLEWKGALAISSYYIEDAICA